VDLVSYHDGVLMKTVLTSLQVCKYVIGSLNHSRDQRASLLPMARGIYDFAMSVSYDVFAYNSRIASTVAYSTVLDTLRELSKQEVKKLEMMGRDTTNWGVLRQRPKLSSSLRPSHRTHEHNECRTRCDVC
jgi:hypothetical protein